MSDAAGMVILSKLEEAKPSTGQFDLPCGYLTPEGVLHTEVVVREITGAEEDLIANQQVPMPKRLSELFARCIQRIGTITEYGQLAKISKELLIGDRVFLTFAIRQMTFGKVMPYVQKCPNPECGKESLYELDLTTLDVKRMVDPKQRVFDRKLSSGKSFRFRLLTGVDEEILTKDQQAHPEDGPSLMLLRRLELFDGKPALMSDLKSLGMRFRQEMRDLMEEVDGGVDTAMEMTCPKCQLEFESNLVTGDEGFFFPSEVYKSWKKRSSG